MKQTQGFGTMGIVGLVAAVLIVGAIGVTLKNNKMAGEKAMMAEKAQMEEKAMMEKKVMEEKAMMDKASGVGQTGDSMEMEADSMMKKDETMKGEESMMKKDDSAMMQKAGVYTTYSADAVAMAQKGKTVLFFHAGWCPTCRTADADITAGAATIPAGVTILKVDYDKEAALKQKYGVTSQHTFVEIDASGTLVEKWSGGNLAGIIAKL
jgi:thioredoxin 1